MKMMKWKDKDEAQKMQHKQQGASMIDDNEMKMMMKMKMKVMKMYI